jgi:hypothetical protein
MSDEHTRPAGATDAAVRASGLMSEALERVERARGALYDAHQLIGSADSALDDVIHALSECGHAATGEALQRELVGMNVIEGRWTFQLMEEFDDGYYARWREWEKRVRDECVDGKRHVLEAEMKATRHS